MEKQGLSGAVPVYERIRKGSPDATGEDLHLSTAIRESSNRGEDHSTAIS
jgi:hypothetical protein